MRSLALALVGLAACAGTKKQVAEESVDFRCKDRVASYVASHAMGGDEIGAQLDCKTNGPQLKRWRTAKDGTRNEQTIAISPVEFDQTWKEINGTGWENLKDCTNGTGGKRDPMYVFDVKDDQNSASFSCQSTSMPYPYNDIVDPLDALGVRHKGQLGDDEPQDAKALDRKDKQR